METLLPGFLSLESGSTEFSFPDLLHTHRTPPQLLDEIVEEIFLRIPPDDRRDYRAHDARHGRVLLNRIARCGDVFQGVEAALVVWDPITDEQWPLPPLLRDQPVCIWTAAVLCGTAGPGACDYLDCCPGHFRVVFVGIDDKEMFSSVYSSDSATWSDVTSTNLPSGHLN